MPQANPETRSAMLTASQQRISLLSTDIEKIRKCTSAANTSAENIRMTARVLDNLTSPATDHSAKLQAAARNLLEVYKKINDARDKLDTVDECKPAIDGLYKRAVEMQNSVLDRERNRKLMTQQEKSGHHLFGHDEEEEEDGRDDLAVASMLVHGSTVIDEDMLDDARLRMIQLRGAFLYFDERKDRMHNSSVRMDDIHKLYQRGLKGICILINIKLTEAGSSVSLKSSSSSIGKETAKEARTRLTTALAKHKLEEVIGDYETRLPFNKSNLAELRANFKCLGDTQFNPNVSTLGASSPPNDKNVKTRSLTKILNTNLKTGYMHLDTYAKSRKPEAFKAFDNYITELGKERKEELVGNVKTSVAEMEARDVVRGVEHAIVILIGEKQIFQSIVAPEGVHGYKDGDFSQKYRLALSSSFSHIAGCVVERLIRYLETTFHKQSKASVGNISASAAAAAAGLRILDGVRILGPTLSKYCDLTDKKKGMKKTAESEEAAQLCIELHRNCVKGCHKALEHFVKQISEDPLTGANYRPPDGGVARVSKQVVEAIRLISRYSSAYKSVTKRRALPWDPHTGEESGDLDSFMKYIISKYCKTIDDKAVQYRKESGFISKGKSHLFVVLNTSFMLESLRPVKKSRYLRMDSEDEDDYKLTKSWFKDKLGKKLESEKEEYLDIWGNLCIHLTPLEKLNNDKDLFKALKIRFGGFNEDFCKIYFSHNQLRIPDDNLRRNFLTSIRERFLNQYSTFYDQYSKVPFSKRKMGDYLKYPPTKVESMVNGLFVVSLTE
eukprot:CAMPEP_0116068550 /NCGR_PEP_ID=MMETSP0322-20121206/11730_1 /TAXON_ID=163516 /ORGANISM="Leptocylindrus danicus var. apora, Strain B651" /LENGTH=782 /DNA_ID=CAMNT_0003555687 /DNA_START=380 /DNA_END=2725 /DNA_ORIENTATION=+